MAVQTDLEPACGLSAETAQVVATLDPIADACDTLRSVIADVRNIIYETNALTDSLGPYTDRLTFH
jgi:hypothetical protein